MSLNHIVDPNNPNLISIYVNNLNALSFNGFTGSLGPVGDIGKTGPRGITGPTGSHGNLTNTGPTGSIGRTGPTGPHGHLTNTGPTGSIGKLGHTGVKGHVGPTGTSTLDGIGTYTNLVLLDDNNQIKINNILINSEATSSTLTYNIPDVGTGCNFVISHGTQDVGGDKTYLGVSNYTNFIKISPDNLITITTDNYGKLITFVFNRNLISSLPVKLLDFELANENFSLFFNITYSFNAFDSSSCGGVSKSYCITRRKNSLALLSSAYSGDQSDYGKSRRPEFMTIDGLDTFVVTGSTGGTNHAQITGEVNTTSTIELFINALYKIDLHVLEIGADIDVSFN